MSNPIPNNGKQPSKSPLHLLGMIIVILRNRFENVSEDFPFKWVSDSNTTRLHIQTYLAEHKDADNAYPRLVVGRGTKVSSASSVNDLDQNNPDLMHDRGTYYHRFGSMDVYIECIAETAAATERLSYLAWATIEMSRHEMCRAMGLLDVSSVVHEPVQPYRKDNQKFSSRIGFRLTFETRHYVLEVARPLNEVRISSLARDAAEYVDTLLLRSSELPEP